jgi:integrase
MDAVTQANREAWEAASRKPIREYDDLLAQATGVDVVVISKLLGHSSIAVTSRYLDHLTSDRAVAALGAVDLRELTA